MSLREEAEAKIAEAKDLEEPIKPLQFVDFNDLAEDISPMKWTVYGVLPEEQCMSMIYGESGTYKSFLTLDMGQHIARGIPWMGRAVQKGAVVVLAGEGYHGYKKRARAYNLKNGKDESAIFKVSKGGTNLHDEKVAKTTADEIREVLNGEKAKLVIVDTLHRNSASADENSSKDWGIIQGNIDKYFFDVADGVMIIHHTGKDTSSGDRGTSSRYASMDAAFSLERDENKVKMQTTKQKDGDDNVYFEFISVVIEVSDELNAYGEKETSLVLEEVGKTSNINYGSMDDM